MQEHYITNLLGLEDYTIKSLQEEDDHFLIEAHTKATSAVCTRCGTSSSRIHDYRYQRVKHTLLRNKVVMINIRKKRFCCPNCLKRFYETIPLLARYQRATSEFFQLVFSKLSEVRSIKSIAMELSVSSPTIIRIFNRFTIAKHTLPAVLCIDEFKGNAGGEKYQCILVDGEHNRIVDILPSRRFAFLDHYFSQFSFDQKQNVKYVLCDMYGVYRDIFAKHFPNALLVIDKFHFARQCFWAFEAVRIRCQKTMASSLRKYYKRSKSIMRKHRKKLSDGEMDELTIMLNYHEDLRKAYYLKERFYLFLDAQDFLLARYHLEQWLLTAKTFHLPEFKNCMTALNNWKPFILNYYLTGYTNAVTEGFNNKIKVIKRVSYGYRNFHNFRNRILFTC